MPELVRTGQNWSTGTRPLEGPRLNALSMSEPQPVPQTASVRSHQLHHQDGDDADQHAQHNGDDDARSVRARS